MKKINRLTAYFLILVIFIQIIPAVGVTVSAEDSLKYDLLGLMAEKTYEENPVLYNNHEISEYLLYLLYSENCSFCLAS